MPEYYERRIVMKLNPDCIRAVLFYLEENLSISSDLEINEISIFDLDRNLEYSINELANTLLVLDDAGFIVTARDDGGNCINELDVYRITYDGYQFIETIRPEPAWKKVKSVCGKIGSFSANVIIQVASNVLTELIREQMSPVAAPHVFPSQS